MGLKKWINQQFQPERIPENPRLEEKLYWLDSLRMTQAEITMHYPPREQLYEARDLNLTTDFRDVLGELVCRHMGNRKLDVVFPGYQGGESKFRGLLSA